MIILLILSLSLNLHPRGLRSKKGWNKWKLRQEGTARFGRTSRWQCYRPIISTKCNHRARTLHLKRKNNISNALTSFVVYVTRMSYAIAWRRTLCNHELTRIYYFWLLSYWHIHYNAIIAFVPIFTIYQAHLVLMTFRLLMFSPLDCPSCWCCKGSQVWSEPRAISVLSFT